MNTNICIQNTLTVLKKHITTLAIFIFTLFMSTHISAQHHHDHDHNGLHHWEIPSKDPDRIILTFHGDPATNRAVTWRTDTTIK